ncbi:hypothetical protein [Streptomyces sp. NPDC093990]|uniref:hypothetical protein n=1 Tax=Streptomyces sp. NPDC093990 TaxID=3155306 RepID=UPI00344745DF
MTLKVTAKFLDQLRVPGTTVRQAAAAASITNTAVYQRRRRDQVVAEAMKEAQTAARGAARA